jgi:hypothetical protein
MKELPIISCEYQHALPFFENIYIITDGDLIILDKYRQKEYATFKEKLTACGKEYRTDGKLLFTCGSTSWISPNTRLLSKHQALPIERGNCAAEPGVVEYYAPPISYAGR